MKYEYVFLLLFIVLISSCRKDNTEITDPPLQVYGNAAKDVRFFDDGSSIAEFVSRSKLVFCRIKYLIRILLFD